MNDGRALIVQGDALHLPLPDGVVDLIVTSPPYWALRSYSAGPGEIGSEPTPQAFLEALWAATAEMMRVLKPTGSCFVNLGDKYSGVGGSNDHGWCIDSEHTRTNRAKVRVPLTPNRTAMAPAKSLMLLPERYRVGCVDRLGLICRSVIVWDKPNGLPESVTDRVRRSHEDWVHLVKQPRYYSATDEIRTPYSAKTFTVSTSPRKSDTETAGDKRNKWHTDNGVSRADMINPLGALPGSVWSIPSEPLRLPDHLGVQHYAAFPSEWPRRLILGFSPPGICVECGQGRVPVVERERVQTRKGDDAIRGPNDGSVIPQSGGNGFGQRAETTATILGYACACTPHTNHPGSGGYRGEEYGHAHDLDGYPSMTEFGGKQHLANRPKVGPWREYHLDRWQAPPTRPAVVLDSFSGTGTVPMVARALGRIGVGVDLSRAYCRAARWRVHHDAAKAISRTNLERQTTLL